MIEEPPCHVLIAATSGKELDRIAGLLAASGLNVTRAETGLAGLEVALGRERPDVLVIDTGPRREAALRAIESLSEPLAAVGVPAIVAVPLALLELDQVAVFAAPHLEPIPRPLAAGLLLARVRAAAERQRLVDRGDSRSRELAGILELSKTVNSTLDSGAILYCIARKLGELMELQRCSFIVPDVGLGIGRVIACKDDPNIHSLEINLDNYPEIKHVLRTGTRVVIQDVEGDPIMAEVRRFADVFREQSIMTLPLKLHEHIIGVLQVRKKSKERGFSDKEIDYAELLANHAASALRNARLYEDRERQNTELRRQKAELEGLSRELRRKNEELVRLTELKEDFTTMIVHDLRSPLMIIQGVLDLLRLKLHDAPDDLELIHDGINVTKKILRLIDNLLEISKLESGELGLELEDLNVEALVADSVEPLEVLASKRNVRLGVDIQAGLPCLRGDRARLSQVIDNLVTNAINFTPDGGAVRLEARLEGEHELRLDVIDTGVGVPPDDLPEIFQRFRQGRLGGARKGTGFGLAIVDLLVKAHAGRIEVESTLGKGSRFSVLLSVGATGIVGEAPSLRILADR